MVHAVNHCAHDYTDRKECSKQDSNKQKQGVKPKRHGDQEQCQKQHGYDETMKTSQLVQAVSQCAHCPDRKECSRQHTNEQKKEQQPQRHGVSYQRLDVGADGKH